MSMSKWQPTFPLDVDDVHQVCASVRRSRNYTNNNNTIYLNGMFVTYGRR